MSNAVIENPSITPLTALDRCDRCGAQAYHRVTFATGGELLFCNHHMHSHAAKLKQVALHHHNESEKLQ